MTVLFDAVRQVYSPDAALGALVNQLMFESRLTRKTVGAQLGITGASLGRKLRGDIAWSLTEVYTLANIFGLDVADLLPTTSDEVGFMPAPASSLAQRVTVHLTPTPLDAARPMEGSNLRPAD